MSNESSSEEQTRFSNYYDLYIGSRDGALHPPEDSTSLDEIRSVMQRLDVGDRIVYRTSSEMVVEPRTVTDVRHSLEDGTEKIEIAVEGPDGGKYKLIDRPQEMNSKWGRPRAKDQPRTDKSGRSAPITAVVLISGATES